jgi:Ca2+-binding RTX toxin-like protein
VKRAVVVIAVAVACLSSSGASSARTCTMMGTSGPDVLFGTMSSDVICGLGGNDEIFGMDGNDVLVGGPGNDYLEGGPGHDTMLGGPGKDSYRSYDATRDVVDGGLGVDSGWADHLDVVRNVEHPG